MLPIELQRENEPQYQINPDSASSKKRKQNPPETHLGDIDIEITGDPRTYPADDFVFVHPN